MARFVHLLPYRHTAMTTSTIIQTIVALGIVAVALVYVLRRVFKTTRGQGDCGCGCGKNCKCKKL
ncbi:MAG: FeoB-associated Cys-rich membrane protein [Bacteroidales bacterium]|nr:FeoB-associated Cys-rich membrane protein [Bacteroidales bacterium]